jgi:hypothetical protein
MYAMPENRNDVKVDALSAQMEKGFSRVDEKLCEQRREMRAGFNCFDDRLDRVYRLMIQFCALTFVALIVLIATQI